MSPDAPVFDLKPLRKQFTWLFLIAAAIVFATHMIDIKAHLPQLINVPGTVFIVVLLVLPMLLMILSARSNKKRLEAMAAETSPDLKFKEYLQYNKAMSVWTLAVIGFFCVVYLAAHLNNGILLVFYNLIIVIKDYPNESTIKSRLQIKDLKFKNY
ncbi:hypothetical protein HHL16_00065 [Pseudoflavitalea sp. G-6-1-2]|uniref:hypothetical protein n=1 Tax=Pseudoflavitalea sp. G-6-1-2 TaxID=2728841 RepID=UPI00146CE0F1|nr:hypothetical protein [Pseudoflavitalea sp. G-6-1-2]NML19238.1 hypothetical protein [Pseudoflavitalea sp. G-6-1-2]